MRAGWMEPEEIAVLESGLLALGMAAPVICEIGLGDGRTLAGIVELLPSATCYAVDNGQHESARSVWDQAPAIVIKGDSAVAHGQVPDGLDFLLVDGCHCENHVMLDFLNYGPKVVTGGCVFFHDASREAPRSQGFTCPLANDDLAQVYPALLKLGLLPGPLSGWKLLAFNEEGLGVALFQRTGRRGAASLSASRSGAPDG